MEGGFYNLLFCEFCFWWHILFSPFLNRLFCIACIAIPGLYCLEYSPGRCLWCCISWAHLSGCFLRLPAWTASLVLHLLGCFSRATFLGRFSQTAFFGGSFGPHLSGCSLELYRSEYIKYITSFDINRTY